MLAVSGAFALSPEQAVDLALRRPEIVRQIQARVELARADLIEARTWPNPELRVEREAPDSPADGPSETGIVLAQQFQLGGRRRLAREAGELGLAAAQSAAMVSRAEVRASVLDRYYTLLAAERTVVDLALYRDELTRLARIAGRRQAEGDLSGYESRRIAQLVRSTQVRLAIAQAEAATVRAELAGWITQEVPPLADHAALAPPSPAPMAELEARLGLGVGFQALARERDAAAASARAARRPMLPVTVGLGQKRFGSVTDGVAADDALVLEFSVPLPLFDRNQAAVARTAALAAEADARHAEASFAASAHLQALWRQADLLSRASHDLREDGIAQAAELSRIALLSFEAGEMDLLGLIDALDTDLQVRERAVDLELRARLATIQLDRLTQGDMP